MSLSTGSVIQWSDIRSLFNRVNAERARWSFSTVTAPTRTIIDIDELVTIRDLLQGMTSNSFLSSAASTNGITLTANSVAKAQAPTSLANVITAVEEVRPKFTGFNAFNEGTFGQGFQYTGTFGDSFQYTGTFGQAFQFSGSFGQGFQHNGTFGDSFQYSSFGTGGTYFGSHGTGGFCNPYGFGGFSQRSFCSGFSKPVGSFRPGGGSPTFTGHRDTSCSTFTFGSNSNGSRSSANSVFCASGSFTNGCSAPHQGFLSGFSGGFSTGGFDFAGGYDDCASAGAFSTSFSFTFAGTFGSGFRFDGNFGSGFRFDGNFGTGGTHFTAHGNGGTYFSNHGNGGTYFSSHGTGGAHFTAHGTGGTYFSNHGTGGGTYFNAHNVAGFCSSHNSASFFASL